MAHCCLGASPRETSPRSAIVQEGALGVVGDGERKLEQHTAASPPPSARDLVADGATLEALNNLVGLTESPRHEEEHE